MGYPRYQMARNFKLWQAPTTMGHRTISSTTLAAIPEVPDLTIAAAPGDILECGVNGRWNNQAQEGRMSVATVVGGTVSPLGDATWGLASWYGAPSVYTGIGAPFLFSLAEAHISNGLVTVRLLASVSAGSKVLNVGTERMAWWIKNLGPADPT